MTIENDILNGFIDDTNALAATLHLPVSFPNVDPHIPDDGSDYLEAIHFINATQSPNWNNEIILQGIWQISLITTQHAGSVSPTVVCAAIIGAFDKDSDHWSGATRIRIENRPSQLSMIQEGHKATYPVSISYRAYG